MIETERLVLRPYVMSDFGAYWSMLGEPAPSFPSRQPMSQEDAWQRLLSAAGHWSLFGYGVFALIDKSTGEFVGETGLASTRRELGDRLAGCDEAGWYLSTKGQGRGLGIEAARAAHSWYGRYCGGRRTFCIVDRLNLRSINLAFKLGYEVQDLCTSGPHELLVLERISHEPRKASLQQPSVLFQPLH